MRLLAVRRNDGVDAFAFCRTGCVVQDEAFALGIGLGDTYTGVNRAFALACTGAVVCAQLGLFGVFGLFAGFFSGFCYRTSKLLL